MMRRPSFRHSFVQGRFLNRDSRLLCRSRRRLKQLFWLTSLGMFMAAILPGCSPLYVLRAAYEEGKILWRREPIADFIQKPDVKPDMQEKLQLVLAVCNYARDVCKFNVGGSCSSDSYA